MERIINIHYGAEIALKGGNRTWFEDLLVRNIRQVIPPETRIIKKDSRILIELHATADVKGMLDALGRVFGIEWYSEATKTRADMMEMEEAAVRLSMGWEKVPLRVETKRADKAFPYDSMEVNKRIGQRLKEQEFPIDLTSPKKTVQVEILREMGVVSADRQDGAGGLPVGSSGQVLSLFSGGIDSPVSSWLMMRRGCQVNYLHMHSLRDNKEVESSKITRLVQQLRRYYPFKTTLYVSPYADFYEQTLKLDSSYELILFRRFLMRVADRIGKKEGAMGLVTGDNLGQVASQTIENLNATQGITSLPIYRPLIAYNKQEIVDLAKRIGTYDASIEQYKDCCSLVAPRNPVIRPDLNRIAEMETEIGIERIVEKTLQKVDRILI